MTILPYSTDFTCPHRTSTMPMTPEDLVLLRTLHAQGAMSVAVALHFQSALRLRALLTERFLFVLDTCMGPAVVLGYSGRHALQLRADVVKTSALAADVLYVQSAVPLLRAHGYAYLGAAPPPPRGPNLRVRPAKPRHHLVENEDGQRLDLLGKIAGGPFSLGTLNERMDREFSYRLSKPSPLIILHPEARRLRILKQRYGSTVEVLQHAARPYAG